MPRGEIGPGTRQVMSIAELRGVTGGPPGTRSDVWGLERVKGIEPSLSAWEAGVLPLNYTRDMVGIHGLYW